MEKESKYKAGETVYAIAHPTVKLIIRRYIPTIYYCTIAAQPEKELVYFERELMTGPEPLFSA